LHVQVDPQFLDFDTSSETEDESTCDHQHGHDTDDGVDQGTHKCGTAGQQGGYQKQHMHESLPQQQQGEGGQQAGHAGGDDVHRTGPHKRGLEPSNPHALHKVGWHVWDHRVYSGQV